MHHLSKILDLISAHPLLAYGAIFISSLADSLPIVGILLPGTIIIFGMGVILATGALSLKPVIISGIAGAIAGDAIGYWLGRHYKSRLNNIKSPRYSDMIQKGEIYFKDHGRKSVFLARFIGPIRPIIPMIAGMSGMRPLPFTIINVVSAVGWAFAYILPGLFFGSSLEVAGAISGRLVILIIILAGTSWTFIFIIKRALSFLEKKGPFWFSSFRVWAKTGVSKDKSISGVKKFIAFIIYRKQGEEILLLILGGLFLAAGWGVLLILQDIIFQDPLVMADKSVYYFLQSLRTPWGDNIFVAITEMGDTFVNMFVAGSILLLLLFKGCYRTAKYWIVAIVGGILLMELLKLSINLSPPIEIYHANLSYTFPSSHTMMSVIIYGFLALMFARGTFHRFQWGFFSGIFFLSFMIAISRLYLGAHWLSDVVGGFFVGIVWVSTLGISYLKHPNESVPRRLLAIVTISSIFLGGCWQIKSKHADRLSFYSAKYAVPEIGKKEWLDSGWQKVAAWRVDTVGRKEEPLNIQWAGSKETILEYMLNQGWRPPPPFSLKGCLGTLSPNTPIGELPVLPHLHKGKRESILLLKKMKDNKRLLFRLWLGDAKFRENGLPLFVGTLEEQQRSYLTSLITIAKGNRIYTGKKRLIRETFSAPIKIKKVILPDGAISSINDSEKIEWDGELFLVYEGGKD